MTLYTHAIAHIHSITQSPTRIRKTTCERSRDRPSFLLCSGAQQLYSTMGLPVSSMASMSAIEAFFSGGCQQSWASPSL